MDEEMKNQEGTPIDEEQFKAAVEETLEKVRTQSMLLGCQVICQAVLDKIYAFESSQGKKSANDYKRCIKELKKFCEIGVSRTVNPDGTTTPKEETAQN